tara:strand:- start:86 stop:253 length:168 start_codon:yes stop_codon:yes gene_type:complete
MMAKVRSGTVCDKRVDEECITNIAFDLQRNLNQNHSLMMSVCQSVLSLEGRKEME